MSPKSQQKEVAGPKPEDSIFKRFGRLAERLVFSYEEVLEEETVSAEKPVAPTTAMPVTQATFRQTEADQELVKHLLASAEELGTAIKPFEEFLTTLRPVITAEEQLFPAAFASAKKTSPNLTVKVMLTAVDQQIKSLATEKGDFETTVQGKEKEIAQDEEVIKMTVTRIEELKSEIEKLQRQQLAKQEEIGKKRHSIESGRTKFEASLGEVKRILTEKKEKIQTYLNG